MATLHTDVPTCHEIDALLAVRTSPAVSLYLPTDPASAGDAERTDWRNLTGEALDQLRAVGAGKDDVAALEEQFADVEDDDDFWRLQARTLAAFATPASLTTFRLPNTLVRQVTVADRMHLTPLLRAVTFPQAGFVLALSQGANRLIEFVPEAAPEVVRVPDLPTDVASAVGKSSILDRSPTRRLQGTEGQKVRMRQYARQVDQALRPILLNSGIPLIVAATEPLAAIFRSVSRYPDLAPETLPGNPDTTSDADLVAAARGVLDRLHAAQLSELHELFDRRTSERRTATDVATVARLAVAGAVDTLLVDMDATVPGSVDEATGAVTFTEDGDGTGVTDEIARLVLLAGGRVLAVRRDDVPGRGEVAALLRYTPTG